MMYGIGEVVSDIIEILKFEVIRFATFNTASVVINVVNLRYRHK